MLDEQNSAPEGGFLRQHHILGVLSLALALLTTLGYCVTFSIFVGILTRSGITDPIELQAMAANPATMPQNLLFGAAAFGLFVLGSPVLGVIGLGLGIGGYLQASHEKVVSILGIIFNALLLCGTCGYLTFSFSM